MRVQKRRRREGKTDYKIRLNLLKGETPRIVFRKSNKYLVSQYVINENAKDKVKFGLNSKILLKYGWPKEFEGSLKSISAAYLLGFLTAKKILKDKIKTPIIDFGMIRVLPKTKPFAYLKGLIDGGLKIKSKEESFPEQDRIIGKNLKKDFSKNFQETKSKIEKL